MPLDLEKIDDSPHLLDILIQCEDILDGLDLYCYRNWFDGELIDGPNVKRHWVILSLLYPFDKMPDPTGARRLIKQGVKVKFSRVWREADKHEEEYTPFDPQTHNETDKGRRYWIVKLSFPRRLIDQNAAEVMDMYDDVIDADDVEDAQDSGMNSESAYRSDDQNPYDQDDVADGDASDAEAGDNNNG